MNQTELAQIKAIRHQLKQLQGTVASSHRSQESEQQYLELPLADQFNHLFSRLQNLENTIAADSIDTPDSIEQSLRVSEEKWRALSMCSPVGIFTCDVQGRVTYTNLRCQEIGGFTLEESLGQGFADFIHADDREGVLSAWFAIAESGKQYADEFRVCQPDGSVHWVYVRTAPIVSDRGELVGHTGTVEDITNQKQAEAQIKASLREKEALLKEIHHRVKNNLQIISSLIYLQSQRTDDPRVREIFQDSQSRISSMALVHDSLYRSQDLAKINLSDYIQTLATSLFYTYRVQPDSVQLNVNIDAEISVSLEKAVPCGLILNELMTNALKHGFCDGKKGEITVLLTAEPYPQIQLIVENDGNNLPEQFELQTIDSMGLRLVHALVNQLQGNFELDKATKTRFKVTFDRS